MLKLQSYWRIPLLFILIGSIHLNAGDNALERICLIEGNCLNQKEKETEFESIVDSMKNLYAPLKYKERIFDFPFLVWLKSTVIDSNTCRREMVIFLA